MLPRIFIQLRLPGQGASVEMDTLLAGSPLTGICTPEGQQGCLPGRNVGSRVGRVKVFFTVSRVSFFTGWDQFSCALAFIRDLYALAFIHVRVGPTFVRSRVVFRISCRDIWAAQDRAGHPTPQVAPRACLRSANACPGARMLVHWRAYAGALACISFNAGATYDTLCFNVRSPARWLGAV